MAQQKPKLVYWKQGLAVKASKVYLDANFIVALAHPAHIWHANALALLAHFNERNTGLTLSSLALNEAIYQLMRLREKESDSPEAVPNLSLWLDDILLRSPLLRLFEPPDLAFHRKTLKAIAEHELDPTDAFHYIAARHLNCPLLSNDAGFQKIPDEHLLIVTFF
ncbi:type II toxin-antitoxin system VapC family toxin [Candidatus Chlorohelix sp.]|uniref:type II toxin-antitoxin system VapC family toxin n=1 Tax=Candidatus Chlorohelix sp. TaxID=3139201 RepID=UPI00304EBDD0